MISHALAKFLAAFIPVSEIMFVRFIFGPLMIFPFLLLGKIKFKITRWSLIFWRTFFGITAMFGYMLALKLGDPGKVSLIFQCSSLWVYVLGKLFFGDNPSIQTKYAIPIAFLGLGLVIQPQNLYIIQLPDLISFIASLLNAGVLLSLKELRRDHGSYSILFANYTLSSIVTGLWMLPEVIIPHKLSILGALIAMGFTGFIGNLCMTIGFKYTSASVASNLMLLLIPLMYLVGIIFFQETLDLHSIMGIVVVLASMIVISKYQ